MNRTSKVNQIYVRQVLMNNYICISIIEVSQVTERRRLDGATIENPDILDL